MSRSFSDLLPHYPEVKATDSGLIPFVERDVAGRIVRAYGTIKGGRNIQGTNVDPKLRTVLQKDRSGPDQAGHIIAKCLGGSGKHLDNLFCQNSSINSCEGQFEKLRKDFLEDANNSIIFEFFFDFENDTNKPSHFYSCIDSYVGGKLENSLRDGDQNFCSTLSRKYWKNA